MYTLFLGSRKKEVSDSMLEKEVRRYVSTFSKMTTESFIKIKKSGNEGELEIILYPREREKISKIRDILQEGKSIIILPSYPPPPRD